MNANKLIRKTIKNHKGNLHLFGNILKNFKLKRIFIIDSKKKLIRGEHGHKKTNQIFISLNDKVKLLIIRDNKKIVTLNKNQAILIPKKNWVRIQFQNNKSSLIVLSDRDFDPNDYFY
mgnify:CR=1 FL=1